MKRDRLRLSAHQYIESGRDTNGRFFIAYSSGASVFVRDYADLRRFLRLPKGIPMRDALESWLSELPTKTGAAAPGGDLSRSDHSFDPIAHQLDESDPQFQTKTIL
jgi:hypothetical protein